MTDDRRQRIEQIYLDALDIPVVDRPRFLDRCCEGDRALHSEVEALLALQPGAEAFLEQPAIESAARTLADILPALRPPEIAGYRIIRHLGEGGMGLVYLAEQETPFRRLVALKLIKPGMDTRQVVARFETERQALALMDHPNIAAVFDAGSTDDGRPYFVMEYVEGVSITDYCDRGRLSTRDRLALFVQVCAAVQHAHQKGVIHRDLKPSNVLVTERDGHALPKVIDFGTAKAIGGAWNATATQGGQGMVLGTLEYMSPEQAALSADIDTATDVYSLGVLLYELLVGRLPFDTDELRAAGYDEIRRVIRESDPPKPSVRVEQRSDKSGAAARARQTDGPGLTRQLRGDLDWITLKALEKDRTRRYATVAAFATDIGCFLDDQPVDARPPSATYRIRKFTRRHRGAVAAAVSLFLVLGAGLVASLSQYLRAERIEADRQRTQAESARIEAVWERRRADSAREATAEAERLRQIATQEAERAVAARDLVDYQNYVITIGAADAEIQARRFSEARQRLLTVPAARRGWEWDHLLLRAEPHLTLPHAGNPARCPMHAVSTLATDPDGKRIYFGHCQHLDSWNTETLAHSVAVSEPNIIVAAAPLGRRVEYSLASDKATPPPEKKWNVHVVDSSGIRSPKLTVDREPACADLSRDGRILAVGLRPLPRFDMNVLRDVGETDVFEVWDVENGRRIWQVKFPNPPNAVRATSLAIRGPQCFVRLSQDTTLIATSGDVVGLWAAATGEKVHVDSDQAGLLPQPIAFSPTSRQLAIGRRNGEIDVLDFVNSSWTVKSLDGADLVRPRPLGEFRFQDDRVSALTFAPDGLTIVSVSPRTDRVIVWDMQSARARRVLVAHRSKVSGLVVHEQGVYTSHADGTVKVEELEGPSGITKRAGSTPLVTRVAISSDGRTVALGSTYGALTVWHPDERREIMVRPAPGSSVSLGFSLVVPLADKRTILTGFGTLGSLTRWDSETRQSVSLPTKDSTQPGCAAETLAQAAVSPNDRYLAMVLGNCVAVRDLATGGTLATLGLDRSGVEDSSVSYVGFLSDESILVAASRQRSDARIMRWNWTTKKLAADRLLSIPPLAIAASKDGRRIALAEREFVTIWDGTLAHEIGRISTRNLNGNLLLIAFSADGTRLAMARSDQTSVLIFDTATSQQLLTLTDDDAPRFLAFTPSGQLVAADSSGGLTIWKTQRPKSKGTLSAK